jgi:hypothetical protein
MLGEPGIAYWRKQFYGNREAVTTAKAWGSNTNLADLVILTAGTLNSDMSINNTYSNI